MKNDITNNLNYADVDEYKMLSLDDRITHGLRMDRSLFNHNLFGDLMNMQNGGMKNMRKTSMGMNYRVMRKINNWYVKKQVNSLLVDNKMVARRMIDLSRPILLDILMPVKPTIKDWTNLSEIDIDNDLSIKKSNSKTSLKSTSRIRNDFPHVVDHSPCLTFVVEDHFVF